MSQESRIIEALSCSPEGLTTDQLALRIDVNPEVLASRMSKFFFYGKINRTRELRNGRMTSVWQARERG